MDAARERGIPVTVIWPDVLAAKPEACTYPAGIARPGSTPRVIGGCPATVSAVRLGVLDVGSNTVHLLVVDAHRGGHPTPMNSEKTVLRLAEHLDAQGRITPSGANALVETVQKARESAAAAGCEDLLAFATSALRDATNASDVLTRVRLETGVALRVLPGEDEARYTFLAVRRWYGWSVGNLLVLDIGGGSLELAAGVDELPSTAFSLPLGAGRLTRERFSSDPPARREIAALRDFLDDALKTEARRLRRAGDPELVVGTSKTFRSLARLTGAAPSGAGQRVRRTLTDAGLRQVVAFISRMSAGDVAELEGVSPSRAKQLLAGALVAEAAMRALRISQIDICPWALREGVILRRLDWLDTSGAGDRSSEGGSEATGRLTPEQARCTG